MQADFPLPRHFQLSDLNKIFVLTFVWMWVRIIDSISFVGSTLPSLHGASSEHNTLQERVTALAHAERNKLLGPGVSFAQPFIPLSPVSPKPEVKFLIC